MKLYQLRIRTFKALISNIKELFKYILKINIIVIKIIIYLEQYIPIPHELICDLFSRNKKTYLHSYSRTEFTPEISLIFLSLSTKAMYKEVITISI